jgi:Domain of unknown function (DUF4304)
MIRSKLKKSLCSWLDLKLEPVGFERKNDTWNRTYKGVVEVIELQTAKSGSACTLNAGVLVRDVHLLLWGRGYEGFVIAPYCTAHARVGQILGKNDVWWDYDSPSIKDNLSEAIFSEVIPFLEKMKSLKAQRDWIVGTSNPLRHFPLPAINCAVIEYKLDNVGAANGILSEIVNSGLGDWKLRAQEVASRLGCNDL